MSEASAHQGRLVTNEIYCPTLSFPAHITTLSPTHSPAAVKPCFRVKMFKISRDALWVSIFWIYSFGEEATCGTSAVMVCLRTDEFSILSTQE